MKYSKSITLLSTLVTLTKIFLSILAFCFDIFELKNKNEMVKIDWEQIFNFFI